MAAGIRSIDKGARFSTHLSGVTAVRPGDAVAFFKAMADGGFPGDELGFSFYPSSSNQPPNRLEAFRKTAEETHREMKRPVFIAEFGYPAGEVTEGAFKSWNHALERYPLTAAGQESLIEDLVRWGIGAGVSGIRPWAPDLPG